VKRALVAAACLSALAELATSCRSDGDSIVVVTVTAATGVPTVTGIRATFVNGASTDSAVFPEGDRTAPIAFDASFSVTLPRARSGNLMVSLEAFGPSSSSAVARGSNMVAIVPGAIARVTVTLVAVTEGGSDAAGGSGGGPGDAGGRGGSGGAIDAGGAGGRGGSGGTGGAVDAGAGGRGGAGGAGGVVDAGAGGRGGAGGAIDAGVGGAGGAGGARPCDGLCTNPIVFTTASYSSGSLGTAATCHETLASLQGVSCANLSSRTFSVNGAAVDCSSAVSLNAKRNGGYCFQVSAGTPDYSSFATF